MGMILDRDRNQVEGAIGVNRIISIDDSPIKICVVTTDEEMRIARKPTAWCRRCAEIASAGLFALRRRSASANSELCGELFAFAAFRFLRAGSSSCSRDSALSVP